MTTVAIIPARKGSKGIIGKNLTILNGKPLVQYSIEAAMQAHSIDIVVLTTDWLDVSKLGKKLGVEYIRDRPKNLSSDTATMVETVDDVLQWLQDEHKLTTDIIVLLQPTSPLRTSFDVDNSMEKLSHEFDSVIAVNKVQEHPYECIEVTSDDQWSYLAEPKSQLTRRQDYDSNFYFINGAIYAVKTSVFMEAHRFVTKKSFFYFMPKNRSVDIDYQGDLDFVEFLLAKEK